MKRKKIVRTKTLKDISYKLEKIEYVKERKIF